MIQKHCWECGAALIEKPLEGEGIVPFCPVCGEYRFPMYNTAVSMIVTDEKTGRILLIRSTAARATSLSPDTSTAARAPKTPCGREILEETGLQRRALQLQPNAVLRAVQHAHVQLYRLWFRTPTGSTPTARWTGTAGSPPPTPGGISARTASPPPSSTPIWTKSAGKLDKLDRYSVFVVEMFAL